MSNQWQQIRSEEGPDLKLFKGRFDYMRNPRNGITKKMVILEAQDAANVVAITPDEHILFVRQYRFGLGVETYELPGGMVDPGEEFEKAAQRELKEETGFTSTHWAFLGKIGSNPVFMNAYVHHYLAKNVQETESIQLDEGELIHLVKWPIEEVRKKLFQGFFLHPHTISALTLFFGNHCPS